MAIKHAFTSAKADGGDSTLVKPSDWNASHVLDAETANKVLASPSEGASAAPTFRTLTPYDLVLAPNWGWIKEDFFAGAGGSGTIGECGISYVGSGSTTNLNSNDQNHPGVVQRVTGATANVTTGLEIGVTGGYNPVLALNNQVFKVTWIVKNDSAAFTNFIQRMGIGNSMSSEPPSSGVYFENTSVATPTTWTLVVKGASTTTNTTSVTIDQSWHRYDIISDGANNFSFYIDDVLAGTVAATPSSIANAPAATIRCSSAESKTLTYDYASIFWQVTR
jgi:hypothetical protein